MPDLPNEYNQVEAPLVAQLQGLGWEHLVGDRDVPSLTERISFRDVLLIDRLRAALQRINVDDNGQPWLDDSRITAAISTLERLGITGLIAANEQATKLLLQGAMVEGDPNRTRGRDQTVHFIDFSHPERNNFLVINQFRVDVPGSNHYIVPDAVLFVNGIPLVVVECKSPATTNPIEEAINQLLRYTNGRTAAGVSEGVERLFHYNQLLVASDFYEARVSTVGADATQYLEWKDTSPLSQTQVATELGVAHLSSQQLLVAGMLRPAHLLQLVQTFILFQTAGGKRSKIVARYQQFRAVQAAIRRLRTGAIRTLSVPDGRGGVIWHTQGSGKSLTMVFLVRALRRLPDLRRFKVVVVTDRTDLEKQLSDTATLIGETPRRVRTAERLQSVLRESGPDLVFAMIQKYQKQDEEDEVAPTPITDRLPLRRVAESPPGYSIEPDNTLFPELNPSPDILVLVDEAHRSQASTLHANLQNALPNCARIGFTGTPILMGESKYTHEIFGPFLDRYTIQQSEADGATVPILYEGRTTDAVVADGRSLDTLFEDMFRDRSTVELEAIKRKYATLGNVLEAPQLIAAKAVDMLRHYVETVLPNGLKAQLVASSRRAAVYYQAALVAAQQSLIAQLENLDPAMQKLDAEALASQDIDTQFHVRAYSQLATIRRLEFATVISDKGNDPAAWHPWSDPASQATHIERFKKPLQHSDPGRQDGLAFLCVKSMLLTGFDAPVEGVLYLDRAIKRHDLLQAIARVNRTRAGKASGLIVDYYGVGRHLKEALAVYSADDIQGVLTDLRDELPTLAARHQRVLAVFAEQGISDIRDVDAGVYLLEDARRRADFVVKLREFLASLDLVLPRPEALPYIHDARLLGFINKTAANRYRDEGLNLLGTGAKVRALIDEHIIAQGIDPQVPPISILDSEFVGLVNTQPSDRAKAAEMEHATRHHISVHYSEDPTFYRLLSRRLEDILQQYADDWTAQVAALRDLIGDVQTLPPTEPVTRFLNLLAEERRGDGPLPAEVLSVLAEQTIRLVEYLRQEISLVDFWRNIHAQNVLRNWIVCYLDAEDIVPFKRQAAVADRVLELAKVLHTRLTDA